MKVSLKEYAEMHNIKHGTVRSYVARGFLTVIDKDVRYTYVDSAEMPKRKSYTIEYGKQPALSNIIRHMKARCYNPKNPSYYRYGGRGIKVCDEWKENTGSFVQWALANGYKEGLTIDRIDPDGDYCPENCQWLTRGENSKKRSEDNRKKQESSCCIS